MFLGGIVNGKWCKGDEFFVEKEKARVERSSLAGPMVFSDCIEIANHADGGKIYTSKAALRRSYREKGYIEVGNERLDPPKPKPVDRKAVRDAAGKALNRVGISVDG